jgi:hypothetical protein
LSRDNDFLRYFDRGYKIYDDYKIDKKGFLNLKEKNYKSFEGKMRKIIFPLPKTLECFPSLIDIQEKHLYRRGAASPLVK